MCPFLTQRANFTVRRVQVTKLSFLLRLIDPEQVSRAVVAYAATITKYGAIFSVSMRRLSILSLFRLHLIVKIFRLLLKISVQTSNYEFISIFAVPSKERDIE